MGLRDLLRRRRPPADAPDDPGAELDRWFRDQSERLAQVRQAVAAIAAARVRLDLAIAHIEGRGEPAAKAEVPGLRREREDLADRERTLREEASRLEGAIGSLRARGEGLRAAHAAAEARARAREAAAAVTRDLGELNLAAIRAQEAVDRARARAEALDEIMGTGTGGPPERPALPES
jgi:phage shock protein A